MYIIRNNLLQRYHDKSRYTEINFIDVELFGLFL